MKRPGSLPKRPKYGNQVTVVGGVRFDSQAEARRWGVLVRLQMAGQIADLRRQVTFELVPSVKFFGAKRATPALRYIADFGYTDLATGLPVIEDLKGMKTRVYAIKKHLLKHFFGIDILET